MVVHEKQQATSNWVVRIPDPVSTVADVQVFKEELVDKMTSENARIMSQLNMERTNLKRNLKATPWIRDGRGGGGWPVYESHLLSNGEQALAKIVVDGTIQQRRDFALRPRGLDSSDVKEDIKRLGITPSSSQPLPKAPTPAVLPPAQFGQSWRSNPPPLLDNEMKPFTTPVRPDLADKTAKTGLAGESRFGAIIEPKFGTIVPRSGNPLDPPIVEVQSKVGITNTANESRLNTVTQSKSGTAIEPRLHAKPVVPTVNYGLPVLSTPSPFQLLAPSPYAKFQSIYHDPKMTITSAETTPETSETARWPPR